MGWLPAPLTDLDQPFPQQHLHPHPKPNPHPHPHPHPHPYGMNNSASGIVHNNMMIPEDGDNRTKNAKAQRRHREKRKAHLKALEESVQVLTAQLEDVRRQLGQAAYFQNNGTLSGSSGGGQGGPRPPGTPLSPQSKDLNQIQAENNYLRDENIDLRRQLYTYRAAYGHPPPPPPDKDGQWTEVKPDVGFGLGYPHPGGMSPRRGMQRGSGEMGNVPDGHVPSTAEGSSSATSSTNSYPPPIEHFTPMHHRSRSRVMSSSSAPSASPYLPSDPRSMDTRYPPPPSIRYEPQSSMYPAPPPHSVTRFDAPPHSHPYGAHRPDTHDVSSWPPESGPPPFTSYPMGFAHDSQGPASDDWRQDH